MKKTAGLVASLVLTLGLLASCSTLFPSGNIVQKDYGDLKDFTAIDASSAFQCTVTQGTAYSITAKVDQNVAEYVNISVSGATLTVGLKPHYSVVASAVMEVAITLPALDTIKLSGAAGATVTGFSAQTAALSFDLSGASVLKWTSGTTAALTLAASGASKATFESLAATKATITLDGASKLTGTAATSTIDDLALNASGASVMTFDIRNSVSGELSGASILNYGLSPSISGLSSSGASIIRAR